jgi:nucleotide-binding universal stress UspA family protein
VYRQVLVPLDGSKFAEAALPLALSLSKRTQAALHLVSVVEPIPSFALEGWELAATEWAERYLDGIVGGVSTAAGGPVTAVVRSGHVVDALLAEMEGSSADIVVMATHGRGVLARSWLGSVADGFMRRTDRPVILVRPQADEAPVTDPVDELRTILVPLDGSELSECALGYAIELGELFGSAYHLTRVVAFPIQVASPYLPDTIRLNQEVVAEARASAAEYLEERAERMRRRGLRVTAHAAVDTQPGHGILKEADEVGCDLIAMATHGRGGAARLIVGSAADKVLRGTHVPLLLYRPKKPS